MTTPSSKSHKISTRIIRASGPLAQSDLHACIQILTKGGVVVFPTDTVYGIAASAFNVDAVLQIYRLKGRSYKKPLPIFLSYSKQLPLVAREIPGELQMLIHQFWPGPLTLVLKTGPMAMVASRGKDTIAVRIPDHGIVKQILDEMKIPLAVTSANLSGKKSCKLGQDVIRQFRGRVDLIIDEGPCAIGVESSVVDATHFPFTVLREGAISKTDLYHSLQCQPSR